MFWSQFAPSTVMIMPNSTAPPSTVFVPFPAPTSNNVPGIPAKPVVTALSRPNGRTPTAPASVDTNNVAGAMPTSSSSESSIESLESESPPITPIHGLAATAHTMTTTTVGADAPAEHFGDVQQQQQPSRQPLVNGHTSKGDHTLNDHVHPNHHAPSGPPATANGIAHLTPAFPMKAGCHRVNNGAHPNWEPCM